MVSPLSMFVQLPWFNIASEGTSPLSQSNGFLESLVEEAGCSHLPGYKDDVTFFSVCTPTEHAHS